jgi:flagellar FliL protein
LRIGAELICRAVPGAPFVFPIAGNVMAEEDDQPDLDAIEDSDEAPKGLFARFKKFIIIGGVAFVLLGGGAGAYFMGLFGGGEAGEEIAQAPPAVFYDLPEMTVNLSSVDTRTRFLKVRISLEMENARTIDDIEPQLPRVLDAFQIYLRELRSTDLDGSAGMHRLKEELTRRVNLAIYPSQIDGVLFREIIVQ